MKLRKLIKQNGKRCLYNNWGKAIAIVLLLLAVGLLFTLVELCINMVFGIPQIMDVGNDGYFLNDLPNTSLLSMALTLIMACGSFLILAPLEMGVTSWYYSLSEGESPEILHIFNCFSGKYYFRALSLQIHLWGRRLLLALLYFALPLAVFAASVLCLEFGPQYISEDMSYVIGSMGIVFSLLLAALLAVFYAIHIQKYFLARYYVVNEGLGVWEAMKKSRHASKGRRGEIFLFQLSWIPWFISCLLVIPGLYVYPYYEISSMIYARVLMEQHYRSTQLVPVKNGEVEVKVEDLSATQVFEAPSERNK